MENSDSGVIDDKNIHAGHRRRFREKFIQDGSLDNFKDHEILEFILFYAYPRKNMNEKAHIILREYGSFHEILNATPEELMKRCNLTERAAVLITMIPDISRRYLSSCWERDNANIISNYKAASDYFDSRMAGKIYESFYMLCLDNRKKIRKCVKISDGNEYTSPVYIDKVVANALLYKSSFVIIAHNHPSGTPRPSTGDLDVTRKIKDSLEPFGIRVLDHIIVCGEDNFSFANKGLCNLKYD